MSRSLSASDRSALIRLASTLPKGSPERKAILSGLSKTKVTSSKRAYSDHLGLRFNFEPGRFSFTTVPIDQYGQVYSGWILMKKPGYVKAYRAAMDYVRRNRRQIEQMKKAQHVLDAISDYARQVSGKAPYWHQYLMPD